MLLKASSQLCYQKQVSKALCEPACRWHLFLGKEMPLHLLGKQFSSGAPGRGARGSYLRRLHLPDKWKPLNSRDCP